MSQLSYKAVGFQLEALKERGTDGWSFSGYASTFGNVDLGGDVVLKGAFSQSLAQRRPKLLWQHDVGEPIGTVASLKEDERGLHGEFKISKTTRGQDAYQLLKDGAVDSLSIGYLPNEVEFDEDNDVRKLKAVDLLEVSIVSFPMNESALITAVKAASRQGLSLGMHADRLLDDVRIFAARYKELTDLRARDGRLPGEAVRHAVAELKALAAGLELDVASDGEPAHDHHEDEAKDDAPVVLRATSARLEIARRRLLLHSA